VLPPFKGHAPTAACQLRLEVNCLKTDDWAVMNMKQFPPFRLDTVNQCLWRHRESGGDERILLKPKAFAILLYLVDHAGRLVTQNELLDAVWPDTHVQPEALGFARL